MAIFRSFDRLSTFHCLLSAGVSVCSARLRPDLFICSSVLPYTPDSDQVEEDNLIMRDMCLRLEAEVAKLRNLLALERGAGGPSPEDLSSAAGGGPGNRPGVGVHGRSGAGGFVSGFAGGGGGGGRGVPRMSHMVSTADEGVVLCLH